MLGSLKRIFLILTFISVVIAVAYLAVYGYNEVKIRRFSAIAASYVEQENWEYAKYWYIKVLELEPENLEAVRNLTEYAALTNDPDEINWWREWVYLEPNSYDALYGLAATLLERGDLNEAQSIVDKMVPGPTQRAGYHNLSTAIALEMEDFESAEDYSRKALLASPDNVALRLNLLSILLRKGDLSDTGEVNRLVEELSSDDETKDDLWRVLIEYSLARNELEDALNLSRSLVTRGEEITLDEYVRHLGLVLSLERDEEILPYLDSIDDVSPILLEEISNVLSKSGRSEQAIEFLKSNENQMQDSLSFQIAYADALNLQENWGELMVYLLDKDWEHLSYYKYALLARAHKALGQTVEYQKNWTEARQLTRKNIREQYRLAQLLGSWENWQSEWVGMLQEMIDIGVQVPWAYDQLHRFYHEELNTRQLLTLSIKANDRAPDNDVIRNNLIMYSLLLDQDIDLQLAAARELYEEYPDSVIPSATYAFALHKNGQTLESLKIMQSLDAEAVRIPEIAFYYALYEFENGDAQAGQRLYQQSQSAILLTEEYNLIKKHLTNVGALQ